MAAAIDRRSRGGDLLGAGEALSPEEALALFLAPLDDPGGMPRAVVVGAPADLCLLDRPWLRARTNLAAVRVRCCLRAGEVIHRSP
jgi:predicted amidohydrolase YtcJ